MALFFGIVLMGSISAVLIFIQFFFENEWPLKILLATWLAAAAFFVLGMISEYLRRPIPLGKSDIVGDYRIDRRFYPGPDAEWQYQHFGFRILPSDSILFVEANDNGTIKKLYKHPIQWFSGLKMRWRVIADTTSHIIENPPTLYRRGHRFYYVFHSKKFGNMFFRNTRYFPS